MAQSLERTLRAEGKSEKTIYSYTLSVRLLCEFLTERDRPLTVDVSRDDIRDFIAAQRKPHTVTDGSGRVRRGGSPATALVRFKSLQQFFKHCVEEDELEVSPMAGMTAPKVPEKPVPLVQDDTLAKLLKVRSGATVSDCRDTALLRLFLDTGCRLAEATALHQRDVDTKEQMVTVRGKGDLLRVAPIGPRTASAIDKYLRRLERDRPEFIGNDQALWMGQQGPMTVSGVTAVLHRMCDDAKVPRLHWHQLRHTFAHTWQLAGGNEGDLMAIAGWKSRSMLDRYAKSARVERAHSAHRNLRLGERV